jgi:predicted transcriptional regulator
VTIPPQDYEAVRRLAKEKKVSASWIVRDAVEKYVQEGKR